MFNLLCESNSNNITIEPCRNIDFESYKKIARSPEIRSQHYGIRNDSSTNSDIATRSWKNNLRQQKVYYKIHMIFWNNEIVGYINFFPAQDNPKIAYIAYSIDKKYWNKGICTIAVRKLLEKYKNNLKKEGIEKIVATVKIDNIGSISVLKKNGFIKKKDLFCNNFPAYLLELKI